MTRTALAVLTLSLALSAQQRDVPVRSGGTSAITGTVLSPEKQPLRRVVVSISSDQPGASRSVITDDAGRFAFSKLPAGTYALTAKKAAYLATEFGSTRPGRPGSRVVLSPEETRTVELTMFRGAAIGGTLRTSGGSPLVGVAVMAQNVKTIGQRDSWPPEPAVTNDRGEYRIYGLMPGEYLVSASPAPGGTGEIGARSASQMDALLAVLADRRPRANAGAGATALPSPVSVAYAQVYFPGTAIFSDAERIRLGPGDDRDVSFEVARVPVASIEGAVSGAVASLAGVELSIIPETINWRGSIPGAPPLSMTSVPPNDQGEFKFGNLPPGKYRIVARGYRASDEAALFGVADVDVRGEDLRDVNLALQPGGTISGKIVFDAGGTPPPVELTRIRVGVDMLGENGYFQISGLRVGNPLSEIEMVAVKTDGTFEIRGLGPSLYALTCTLPPDVATIWKVRSAIAGGQDLLDVNITGPQVSLRDVTVTLSDKRTEISGSLLSASGQPTSDYFVVAFPVDPAQWWPASRRNQSARPTTQGRFVFSDLPAGEYYIAALADLDPSDWQDAAFLSQVAPSAIRMSLAEGEKKVQDLRIK
jgi:hypothetical protein